MSVTQFIDNPRVRRFPDLTWYYHIPPNVLRQMKNWMIDLYIEELPRLQAESQRWAALCSLYGTAEAGDFRVKMDEYWDKFIPSDPDPGGEQNAASLVEAGITSPEEHAAMLAGMGIAMVIEPPLA